MGVSSLLLVLPIRFFLRLWILLLKKKRNMHLIVNLAMSTALEILVQFYQTPDIKPSFLSQALIVTVFVIIACVQAVIEYLYAKRIGGNQKVECTRELRQNCLTFITVWQFILFCLLLAINPTSELSQALQTFVVPLTGTFAFMQYLLVDNITEDSKVMRQARGNYSTFDYANSLPCLNGLCVLFTVLTFILINCMREFAPNEWVGGRSIEIAWPRLVCLAVAAITLYAIEIVFFHKMNNGQYRFIRIFVTEALIVATTISNTFIIGLGYHIEEYVMLRTEIASCFVYGFEELCRLWIYVSLLNDIAKYEDGAIVPILGLAMAMPRISNCVEVRSLLEDDTTAATMYILACIAIAVLTLPRLAFRSIPFLLSYGESKDGDQDEAMELVVIAPDTTKGVKGTVDQEEASVVRKRTTPSSAEIAVKTNPFKDVVPP